MDVIQKIADELAVTQKQVIAAVTLLDEGATVPFIARYRKEITGGLDDIQLRQLDERLIYLRELNTRRETILESIEALGKLTPALEQSIKEADTKTRLEDLYLPINPLLHHYHLFNIRNELMLFLFLMRFHRRKFPRVSLDLAMIIKTRIQEKLNSNLSKFLYKIFTKFKKKSKNLK